MNSQDLLDYHLGQMDERERQRFESLLAADRPAADRSGRIAAALMLLLDDGSPPEPHTDLTARTVQVMRDASRSRPFRDWAPLRLPVRWADAAVAAAILLAGLGTLVPALLRTRQQALTVACAGNLHQVGVGLASYAMANGHYPQPPDSLPVGVYGAQLQETGLVPDPTILTCPTSAIKPPVKLPSIDEFKALHARSPKSCEALLHDKYAYQVGFRSGRDKAEAFPARLASVRPLLADPPPLDGACRVLDGNSPNHGGGGQNVLFSDNHVEWRSDRKLLPDLDIYRNANNKTGLGLHPGDVSLIPAPHHVELE